METQNITLEGREFPVPPLSLGQIKIVVPAVLRLRHMVVDKITEENIKDLIEIAFHGAKKGNPALKIEDVMAMHITVDELMVAKTTVALQAGMISITEPKPGEAAAGASSTGMK